MSSSKVILIQFMKEMNAWEKRCALRTKKCLDGSMPFDEATRIGEEEYMHIFDKYCSPSKCAPRDFHYSEPPDYDPDNEHVLAIQEHRPEVTHMLTQQNYGFRERHKFMLGLEAGDWKLFGKEILLDDGATLNVSL